MEFSEINGDLHTEIAQNWGACIRTIIKSEIGFTSSKKQGISDSYSAVFVKISITLGELDLTPVTWIIFLLLISDSCRIDYATYLHG